MLQAQWNLLNKLHTCHCRSVLWVPGDITSSLYNQIFVLAGKRALKNVNHSAISKSISLASWVFWIEPPSQGTFWKLSLALSFGSSATYLCTFSGRLRSDHSRKADGKGEESSWLLVILGRGGKSEDSKFFNLQVLSGHRFYQLQQHINYSEGLNKMSSFFEFCFVLILWCLMGDRQKNVHL